jgi:arylsulfatase A-like enzyme
MNQQGGSAGMLREGKGSTWEGGMRVPGIAWWPGKIKPAQTQRTLACTMDLFTTSLKLAGAEVPGDRPIDGLDIRPLLFGTGTVERDGYFFYRGTRLMAARVGDFKAHFMTQAAYSQPKHEEHTPPLLFHLKVDASESFNVATNHPAVLSQIAQAVERHKATVKPAPSQLVEVQPLPEKK